MNSPQTQAAIDEISIDLRKSIQLGRQKALFYGVLAGMGMGLFIFFLLFITSESFRFYKFSICAVMVFSGWLGYTRNFVNPIKKMLSDMKNEPTTAVQYADRAYIFAEWEHFEAAESDFRKALELDPNDDITHYYYALTLTTLDRDEEALQALEPILHKPGDEQAEAYALHGRICQKMKNPQTALESFAEAIRIEPDEEDHYLDRAELLIELDQLDEAEEDLREVARIRLSYGLPLEKLHTLRCELLMKKNEFQEALKEINLAIQIAGKNTCYPELYEQRAKIHDKLGNFSEAEEDRKKAARLQVSL